MSRIPLKAAPEDPRETELKRLQERVRELKPVDKFIYSQDDIGFGALYADCFKDTTRFNVDDGMWYVYRDGVWKPDKGNIQAEGKVSDLIRILRLYLDENQNSIDSGLFKRYQTFLKRRGAQNSIKQTLNAAKVELGVETCAFDCNPYLLNCSNGIFDLKSQSFRKAKPMDLCRLRTQCEYTTDEISPNHRWYTFIDEIMSGDKEKAHFLQKALGASLLGEIRDECMFVAYGAKTRNGKGTLFNTIKTVLGSYAGTIDSMLLCESKYKNTDCNKPEPMLASTVGVRYLTLSETDRNAVLDSKAVKSLTGRDPRQTRKLNAAPFTFTPQFTMWLSTNFLPAVKDDTVFTSSRLWVIEFDEHFDESTQDVDLKEQFIESQNRSVILRWLLDGYKLYVTEGLRPPKCVIDATYRYAKRSSQFLCFKDDCLVVGDGYTLDRPTAYKAYTDWCLSSHQQKIPMGKHVFFEHIEQDFTLKDSHGNRRYIGVGLKKT